MKLWIDGWIHFSQAFLQRRHTVKLQRPCQLYVAAGGVRQSNQAACFYFMPHTKNVALRSIFILPISLRVSVCLTEKWPVRSLSGACYCHTCYYGPVSLERLSSTLTLVNAPTLSKVRNSFPMLDKQSSNTCVMIEHGSGSLLTHMTLLQRILV